MGYAILRVQKLKDKGSIRRSLKHSFRAQDTPNADPERTPDNSHVFADSVDSAMNNITQRLDTQKKIRKNAVLAVEYLVTGSPESVQGKTRAQQDDYFQDAIQWLKAKHGAENVVYAGIHRDEQTPHLYAYVVPIDHKEKLNCRAFLGGSKMLNEMQTDFAETVGIKHGLERGIEGSKAKHQSIKKYYAAIQRSERQTMVISPESIEPKVLKKGIFTDEVESTSAIATRLTKAVDDAYQEVAANASISRQERKRADDLSTTMQNQRKQLITARRPFQGLTKDQVKNIVEQTEAMRFKNKQREVSNQIERKQGNGFER
ncbi:MAG: MobV family relaxase [Vibrio gallaecicus]